jgi:hypothetical protein
VDNEFDEEKFIKSLNNDSYIPAVSIQRQMDDFIADKKEKQNGIISLEQYFEYFTDLYSKLFTNQYFFLKAHLISKENKTRLNLNRKLAGGLDKFEYNLTTINLLKTIKPELQEEDTTSVGQVDSNEPIKKHKKKRKKKKKQTQAAIEGLQKTDESSSKSSTSTTSEVEFQNSQKDDPLPHEITEVPFILGNQTFEDKKAIEETLNTTSILPQKEPLPEAPMVKEKNKEASSLIDTQEKVTRKEKEQPPKVMQEISQMQKLNTLLNEHDGGPSAGMKTRKFLRLCTALHENGFFSEFTANKKEVYVKVDGMASVMHVENHSANRKSPGVSRNTAKKLQEIIEIIKNSIE